MQQQLHGYPQGWSEELERDPQARIKIVSLFKKWIESGAVRLRPRLSASPRAPTRSYHSAKNVCREACDSAAKP